MIIDFRPPIERNHYNKWLDAIGQHQKVKSITYVCNLHFKPEEIYQRHKRISLKSGSIPSIFASNQHENNKRNEFDDDIPVRAAEQVLVVPRTSRIACMGFKSSPEQQQLCHDLDDNQTSNSDTCRNCIDNDAKMEELLVDIIGLKQKLMLQNKISQYWKTIALKHEPEHTEPNWTTSLVAKFDGEPNESMNGTLAEVTEPPVPEFNATDLPIKIEPMEKLEIIDEPVDEPDRHIFKRNYKTCS